MKISVNDREIKDVTMTIDGEGEAFFKRSQLVPSYHELESNKLV